MGHPVTPKPQREQECVCGEINTRHCSVHGQGANQQRIPGRPPYRVAGVPAGIISADDYDVTDEAFKALAAHNGLLEQYEDALRAGLVIKGELNELEEQLEAARVLLMQAQRLHDNRSHAEWAERAEAFVASFPASRPEEV